MAEKNTKSSNPLLVIIIIQVFIIIWILLFNTVWTAPTINLDNNSNVVSNNSKDIKITVIDDKRCNNCYTSELVSEITSLPFLAWAALEMKDFSDSWVSEYLIENNIENLPAIILNTNNVWDSEFSQFLTKLPNDSYSLVIWASFNPFQEMSERGFAILEEGVLEEIRQNSYILWWENAEVTWVEYSDFGCDFCVRMHAVDKTPQTVKATFWDKINIIFQHMAFRNQEVPQAIECISEWRWDEFFYDLLERAFDNRVTNRMWVYNLVDDLNTSEVDACINEWRFASKVQEHMSLWQRVFNVTWTPWNVLINNNTWEYEILPWAYPASEFERVINNLMQ